MSSIRPFHLILAISAIIALAAVALDAYLRSFNAPSAQDHANGVLTRMGTYTSFAPLGFEPVSLVTAVKKWSDRTACISDLEGSVLRWADFKNTNDVKVCLSRVFSREVKDERAVAILISNGFTNVSIIPSINNRFTAEKTKIIAICDRHGSLCGVIMDRFWSFPFKVDAYTVGIARNNGETLDINITKITE